MNNSSEVSSAIEVTAPSFRPIYQITGLLSFSAIIQVFILLNSDETTWWLSMIWSVAIMSPVLLISFLEWRKKYRENSNHVIEKRIIRAIAFFDLVIAILVYLINIDDSCSYECFIPTFFILGILGSWTILIIQIALAVSFIKLRYVIKPRSFTLFLIICIVAPLVATGLLLKTI